MGRATKRAAANGPVEGPWALPDGWRWERLGDLGTWCGGGTPSKARPDYWSDGVIPWVSPKDMKRFEIDSTEDLITPAAVAGSAAKMVPAGSVLCVMRSGILRHTFPVAVASVDVTLNQDMRALTLPKSVSPKFVAHYLRFSGQSVLATASKEGTTVNSIEASRLDQHPVPLPNDVERQVAIVARIDALFGEVEEGEVAVGRARSDLATWRKALLKAAVTGELTAHWRAATPPAETGANLLARILADRRARWQSDPRNKGKRYVEPAGPDVSCLLKLPDGWTWATIEQLSWASGYGTSEKCAPDGAGTPVLRIPNIRGGSIDLNDLKLTAAPLAMRDGAELDVGDLLIIRTNGSEDLIGRAAVVLNRPTEPTYFASYLIRLRLIGSTHLLSWLALLVDSTVFRGAVLRSIASSAGQYNLSLSKIESFAVPIPPLDEVSAILERVGASQEQMSIGRELIEAVEDSSAALRQSILAAAFRGELAA